MKIVSAMGLWISLLTSGMSFAAAPELHVTKTVTIAAAADKVWEASKNFDQLNTWLPEFASDQILSGTNNSVGAVRLLTLKAGGTVKEKLLAFDEAGHRYRYTILESGLPVSHYVSRFVVSSLGSSKTLVTWSGSFKRKDLGDNPVDAENDKAAVDVITGVYTNGLASLKKLVESQ